MESSINDEYTVVFANEEVVLSIDDPNNLRTPGPCAGMIVNGKFYVIAKAAKNDVPTPLEKS